MQQIRAVIPRRNYPEELTGRQSLQPAHKPIEIANKTQKEGPPHINNYNTEKENSYLPSQTKPANP